MGCISNTGLNTHASSLVIAFFGLLWSRCKRTKGNGTSAIRRLLWQERFTLKQSRMSDGWDLVNILRLTIVIICRCHLIWYIELLWLLNHKVCFQKRAISVNPLRSDDTEERKVYKSCAHLREILYLKPHKCPDITEFSHMLSVNKPAESLHLHTKPCRTLMGNGWSTLIRTCYQYLI